MRAEFCLAAMKAQWRSCGRMLLGDNTGGGAVMLRPVRFEYTGVRVSTGLPCEYVVCVVGHKTSPLDLRRTFRNAAKA